MLNKILNFIKSKKVAVLIAVLFSLAILVGTFSMGVVVGFRKARFSYAWGESYHRNFGGPRGGFFAGMFRDFAGRDFTESHGTFGQIIKIDGSSLVVESRDNIEKVIIVNDNTDIRSGRSAIKLGDLKANDYITVIGEPDDKGQIVAKFIRVMLLPSPMLHR